MSFGRKAAGEGGSGSRDRGTRRTSSNDARPAIGGGLAGAGGLYKTGGMPAGSEPMFKKQNRVRSNLQPAGGIRPNSSKVQIAH